MSTIAANRVRYVITDETDHHIIDTAPDAETMLARSDWRTGVNVDAYRVVSPRNLAQVTGPGEETHLYEARMRGVFVGYVEARTIVSAQAIAQGHYGPATEVIA